MDFLNQASAQIADVFRSMSVGTRVVAALLLVAVVVSLVYLFQYQVSGGDEYLLGGRAFSASELTAIVGVVPSAEWDSSHPRSAMLSDSVPPRTKNTSEGFAPIAYAISARASSSAARAARPQRWTLDGLPNVRSAKGSIASTTSSLSGVVAAWSR